MNKYDRQTRLWSQFGQQSLENAHVLALNVSPAMTEFLKNLVLAGVGHIVIVADKLVDQADIDSNFFVNETRVGQNIALACAESLQDLNTDVSVSARPIGVGEFLKGRSEFSQAAIVIATLVDADFVDEIQKSFSRPLVLIDAINWDARLVLSFVECAVIDTHPETLVDLRFDNIWHEYRSYVNSFELDTMDPIAQEHVPFVVLLIKALDSWKASHNGASPFSKAEKIDFKNYIRDLQCTPFQRNIEQAIQAAWRVSAPALTPQIKKLIENVETIADPTFRMLVRALSVFVSKHGVPPVCGILPDMDADTASYVQLKQIYKNKAHEDLVELRSYLEIPDEIPLEILQGFCRNCRFSQVFKGLPAREAVALGLRSKSQSFDNIQKALEKRTVAAFKTVPTVAAFIGGIGAQEVCKLLMHQYEPVHSLFIFNGKTLECTSL